MKNFLIWMFIGIVAGTLVAGIAQAALYKIATSSHPYVRTAPTSSAPSTSEKLNLAGCKGIRVTFCGSGAGILTGGTMRGWYEHPAKGWSKNSDLDLSIGSPGTNCKTWGDLETTVGEGSAFWTADGITGAADGGTLYLECYNHGP